MFHAEACRCQRLQGVLLCHPLAITAGGDALYPSFVVQIPLHCFADAALEGLSWIPSELCLDLSRVHRIAPIMARPIRNKPDQVAVRNHCILRAEFIKY